MIRRTRWLAGVLVLALVAFLASALIPGSHNGGVPRFALADTARHTSGHDALPVHLTKAFGASGRASRYGTLDAKRENQGVDAQGNLTSDLTPVSTRALAQPIAEYRRYAERWAVRISAAGLKLRAAITAGDRAGAEHAWDLTYFDFLHLGADYNLLPTGLTNQLAQIPSSVDQRHFTGLHRIERGLWSGQKLSSLISMASAFTRAVARLRHVLPTVSIDTLAYTLRIHEVLEDAQRDLLSGSDVPWSGQGVLATDAGVAATRELLSTVRPVLEGRDNSYAESNYWLAQLQQALVAARRRGGNWPTVSELTMLQRERINAAMAGTLEALSQVPGALETRAIDAFPAIPSQARHHR